MSAVDEMIEKAAEDIFWRDRRGCDVEADAFGSHWWASETEDARKDARTTLESLGLPLETLAALGAGTWMAIPRDLTPAMECQMGEMYMPFGDWQAAWDGALAAAPTTPDDDAVSRPQAAEACQCHRCLEERDERIGGMPVAMTRMILCPICGNKRCPHATDHRHACTGSNEPGQPGSIYGPPCDADSRPFGEA